MSCKIYKESLYLNDHLGILSPNSHLFQHFRKTFIPVSKLTELKKKRE